MTIELAGDYQRRLSEYKNRKKRFVERTFPSADVEGALADGWEVVRENLGSTRMQRLKPPQHQLEDDLWCVLFQLGFPSISLERAFEISPSTNDHEAVAHSIVALDDETVVVCRCIETSTDEGTDRQAFLDHFAASQKPTSNELRKGLGGTLSQKIIWLAVSRGVDWTPTELAFSKSNNIRIVNNRDLQYYREISKRLGPSARHQFHAEFLEGVKVGALNKKVFALRTKLGRYRAYTFFAPASAILPIAFVNHRDLRDPEASPSYQRLILRPRLKEISRFLEGGGFFPNAIILNFKRKVQFEPLKAEDENGIAAGSLILPNVYKSAWVIDGQHRLYGYAEMPEGSRGEHLPILAFEEMPVGEESRIFADINSKQKSVPPKLLDEIAGEIKLDSPDKAEQIRAIASRSLSLMRDDDRGPLGDKIADAEIRRSESSIITVPTVVDNIVQSGLLGRVQNKDGEAVYVPGPLYWAAAKDGVDSLAELLSVYFDTIRVSNNHRWDAGRDGRFATNAGVGALVRLLSDLIAHAEVKEGFEARDLHPRRLVERAAKYASPILEFLGRASDAECQQKFSVPPGSSGVALFQHRLRELVHTVHDDFDPPGFRRDLAKYDADRRKAADSDVKRIVEAVHSFVVERLRQRHGDSEGDFLEAAIENKEILKKAYEKRIDDPEKQELATYLDFIDLRKIVEKPANWEMFKAQLNIRLPSDGQNKNTKCVTWFDEINVIRRISAHPYKRYYDEDQIGVIKTIHDGLVGSGVIQLSS